MCGTSERTARWCLRNKCRVGEWTGPFRLRGVPVLYLEAKRPGTNLDDPAPAHQAINYAYNKGVAWAILTDFESLRLYNAEWDAPNPNFNLFFEIGYRDYATDPRMAWLSREAMVGGILDAEATKVGKRLRKTPVGQRLFEDLLAYRSMLRIYMGAYNEQVAPAEIDHAVQRLLDRLIFIRTAEDRHVEEQHLRPLVRRLREASKLSRLWPELLALFREFDGHYDSQLFARQRLDELETEHEPIRVTIEGPYGTRNGSVEYDFGAIDADVLGGAYEHTWASSQRRRRCLALGSRSRRRCGRPSTLTPGASVKRTASTTPPSGWSA